MKLKEIIKNSKKRQIVILNSEEKEKRSCLKERLNNLIDFPSCVYAYVKNKSAKKAFIEATGCIDKYKYFIKCDVKEFFNNIDCEILLNIISKEVMESSLIDEIKEVLTQEKEEVGVKGISLGSPLSNILSNIYLINFDRKYNNDSTLKYFRFCDDMLFLSDNNIVNDIKLDLKNISLELNEEKIFIGTYGDSAKYLGFNIEKDIKNNNEYIEVLRNFNKEYTKEEVINLMIKNKNKNYDYEYLKMVFSYLEKNFPLEYSILFKYIYFNGDKDKLKEELVENKLYGVIYRFEELLDISNSGNDLNNMIFDLFSNNKSGYYVSGVNGEVNYKECKNDLNIEIIDKHLNGDIALAVRLDREDDKSNIFVIDIDDKLNEFAKLKSSKIKEELLKRDIKAYTEFSGNKGYHVWIFFKEYVSIKDVNEYIKEVLNSINIHVNEVEIIPRYNALSITQRIIKIPFGIHPESGKKSSFLDLVSPKEIVKNECIPNEESISEFWDEAKEKFIYSYKVAISCNITKKIIEYGLRAKSMSHFNRLILSYIFVYLEDGQDFIHYVLQYMSNYNYSITQKYIDRAPENPISCRKLKDYFKDTNMNCNGSCVFREIGAYDTPILHSGESKLKLITCKNQIKETVEEFFKLQHERKNLNERIRKLEKKLEKLYEDLGEEYIELPMGQLRKKDEKWIIEIDF